VNELEAKEIITSMITLYGASIFLQIGEYDMFKLATSIFILVVNANFFLFWIYVLLKNIKRQFLGRQKVINFMEKYFRFKDKGHEENIDT